MRIAAVGADMAFVSAPVATVAIAFRHDDDFEFRVRVLTASRTVIERVAPFAPQGFGLRWGDLPWSSHEVAAMGPSVGSILLLLVTVRFVVTIVSAIATFVVVFVVVLVVVVIVFWIIAAILLQVARFFTIVAIIVVTTLSLGHCVCCNLVKEMENYFERGCMC